MPLWYKQYEHKPKKFRRSSAREHPSTRETACAGRRLVAKRRLPSPLAHPLQFIGPSIEQSKGAAGVPNACPSLALRAAMRSRPAAVFGPDAVCSVRSRAGAWHGLPVVLACAPQRSLDCMTKFPVGFAVEDRNPRRARPARTAAKPEDACAYWSRNSATCRKIRPRVSNPKTPAQRADRSRVAKHERTYTKLVL